MQPKEFTSSVRSGGSLKERDTTIQRWLLGRLDEIGSLEQALSSTDDREQKLNEEYEVLADDTESVYYFLADRERSIEKLSQYPGRRRSLRITQKLPLIEFETEQEAKAKEYLVLMSWYIEQLTAEGSEEREVQLKGLYQAYARIRLDIIKEEYRQERQHLGLTGEGLLDLAGEITFITKENITVYLQK